MNVSTAICTAMTRDENLIRESTAMSALFLYAPLMYIALISTKIFSQLLYGLSMVITGFGQICLNLNPGP